MSISRELGNLQVQGVYLTPLILFFHHSNQNAELWLVAISVFGAVVAHGFIRSVFGPGGPEENPLLETTALQRCYAVLFGKGPPEKLPESHLGVLSEVLNGKLRLGIIRLTFIAFCGTVFFGWGYATIHVFLKMIDGIDPETPVILLAYFALTIWALQWAIWPRFDSVYLVDMIEYGDGTDNTEMKGVESNSGNTKKSEQETSSH